MYMDLHTVVLEQGGRTENVMYVGDETYIHMFDRETAR